VTALAVADIAQIGLSNARCSREAERLRKKRKNPAYLAAERKANRDRMRMRRGDYKTPYAQLERSLGWWK
jgi:hypothetical protein